MLLIFELPITNRTFTVDCCMVNNSVLTIKMQNLQKKKTKAIFYILFPTEVR